MTLPSTFSTLACAFPGQGSQRRGMGADLFDRYPDLCSEADEILGYSVRELCLRDPDRHLRQTAYTQPALFVVNALTWLDRAERGPAPKYLAGHSLGELNALWAAGCLEFADGLRLVKSRGALMAEATGGGMLAVLGLDKSQVERVIEAEGLPVDIANLNLKGQLVLAGRRPDLELLAEPLKRAGAAKVIPLNVSGAFHSRYMAPCADAFAEVVRAVRFRPPQIPVIANANAQPYGDDIGDLLVAQIRSPVRWADTMTYFRRNGVTDFEEIGPGHVLTKLWAQSSASETALNTAPDVSRLGSDGFRRAYGTHHAYVVGSTTPGIRSPQMVARAAKAGLPIYLDDYRPSPEPAIEACRRALEGRSPFGVSLYDETEEPVVDAALKHGVHRGEAVGYRRISPALVRFRFQGTGGRPSDRRLMALVTSEYQAELFCRPAPEPVIEPLLADGTLSAVEAEAARQSPVATELCALGDTAEGRPLSTLLPSVRRLRDRLADVGPVYVGAGGALGSPEAIASAFFFGADFVRTGAVQLTSVESGLPETLRRVLCELAPGDTTVAPSAQGFTLGARRPVVKKGSFFAARAQKLYELYRFHDSLDSLAPELRAQLESSIFRQSLESVRRAVRPSTDADLKAVLADVCRWYLEQSLKWTLEGQTERRLDFQIPCDASLAAFNRYAETVGFKAPEDRGVVETAERLMADAQTMIDMRCRSLLKP